MEGCKVDGCSRSGPYVREWCSMHYSRWKRGRSVEGPEERRGLSESERIWQYIDVGDFDECWEWTRRRTDQGYGQAKDANRRTTLAHRIAWEQYWRQPLQGLGCHDCNNPPCCNPTHVYDGTTSTNALDSVRAGTANFLRADLPKARGEQNGNAKLTEEAVRDIRRRYTAGGISQQKLADEYGVAQTKISDVIRRVTWAHVE